MFFLGAIKHIAVVLDQWTQISQGTKTGDWKIYLFEDSDKIVVIILFLMIISPNIVSKQIIIKSINCSC